MKKRWFKGIIAVLMIVCLAGLVLAEKIDIQIKNNYLPGEDVNLKVLVYDGNNNLVQGEVSYVIENYYTDVMKEGKVNSGEEVVYTLPTDSILGPWRVVVKYNNIETNRLFNVGKLEKAEIKLEGDELLITNTGNVPYEKPILIYIDEQDQTANVRLEVGETKKIRLTAQTGEHTVRVNDGTSENDLVFNGVALTGNVIGLESVSNGNFWQRFPMVSLFLIALVVVTVAVAYLRFSRQYNINKINKK